MRIKKDIIQRLKGATTESIHVKSMLSIRLNKQYTTIVKLIEANEEDGTLTTLDAISCISKHLQIPSANIIETAEPSKA